MGTVASSGAISLTSIKAALGGPASPALSNYYRGGVYTPSSISTSVLTYDPAGGGFTSVYQPATYWLTNDYEQFSQVYWAGVPIVNGGRQATSLTSGIYTYYRGVYGIFGSDTWTIRRTYMANSTTQLNTSVPTSGQISMSQLYGATTG
jgi:hypothetical protein